MTELNGDSGCRLFRSFLFNPFLSVFQSLMFEANDDRTSRYAP